MELRRDHSFLLAVDFSDRRDFSDYEKMKTEFLDRSKKSEALFVLTFGTVGSAVYHNGQEYLCPAVHSGPVADTAYVGGIPPGSDSGKENAVFLIRHGESMGNLTGDYSTNQHDNLSPRGQEQAKVLAGNLSDFSRMQDIGAIVCSPLGRARQTIAPFLERSGLKAQIWPDLAECCWQEETDAPLAEPELPFHVLSLEAGEDYLFKVNGDGTVYAPSEHESFQDGLRRMERVAEEILSLLKPGVGPVLVVCHAFCVGKLIHFLTGEGDPPDAPDLVNTSVTKLVSTKRETRLSVEYFDRLAFFQ